MPDYFPERHTIVVIRAQHQTLANQIIFDVMRNPDGSPSTDLNTFTAPLKSAGDATQAVVAYWNGIRLTQVHRDGVLAEIGNRFKQAVTPIPLGNKVNRNAQFWVFDAEPGQWTDVSVFSALGMEPVEVPE